MKYEEILKNAKSFLSKIPDRKIMDVYQGFEVIREYLIDISCDNLCCQCVFDLEEKYPELVQIYYFFYYFYEEIYKNNEYLKDLGRIDSNELERS